MKLLFILAHFYHSKFLFFKGYAVTSDTEVIMEHLDHLQPSRVDPRKQALLEARFFARDKVNLNIFLCRVRQLKLLNRLLIRTHQPECN